MIGESFTYDITDYAACKEHLRRMRTLLTDIVSVYDAAKRIPEKKAPSWTGDTKDYLVSTMEDYGKKAKQLNATAEELLIAALEFCEELSGADSDLNSSLKGIDA